MPTILLSICIFWTSCIDNAILNIALSQQNAFQEIIFEPFPNPDHPDAPKQDITISKKEFSDFMIFSNQDRKLYQRIFNLQQQARWDEARALIVMLEDTQLMGYVDFQRLMHPTGWYSSFSELAEWLDKYADHFGAGRIFRLAKKRRPFGNTRHLVVPENLPRIISSSRSLLQKNNLNHIISHESSNKYTVNKKIIRSYQTQNILSQIRQNISDGSVTAMWNRLHTWEWRQHLKDQDYIAALGDIAKGYVIYQRDDKAIDVADEVLSISPEFPSQAFWWAGLAAWRLENYPVAAEFFLFLSNHPRVQPNLSAASGFWAWRALLRLDRLIEAHQSLLHAATDGYSFYSQLARHALGIPVDFAWSLGINFDTARELILKNSVLRRIIGLSEIGQIVTAQAEVNRLRFKKDISTIRAMALITDKAGLAAFTIKLGLLERKLGEKQSDITRYPLPRWPFQRFYSIDRALLFALIRKESLFSPTVTSPAGASGLMQLMPETARLMERRLKILSYDPCEPSYNLMLGQEYLHHLLSLPEINYNLIYTLAGYNAGPGRLNDWLHSVPKGDDPLLFLETIPVQETREYVENVLADMWIYRHRLGQPTPSKTFILEGNWPIYQRFDIKTSIDQIE